MTVEASFLIPMVLCIIVIMLYTAFYLYDRCLFHQDAYLLCYRESITKEESTIQNKVESAKTDVFGKKYYALSSIETSVNRNGRTIALSGTGKVQPAAFGGYFLMPKSIWMIRFAGAAKAYDPPLQIRKFRRIIHVSGAVTDHLR